MYIRLQGNINFEKAIFSLFRMAFVRLQKMLVLNQMLLFMIKYYFYDTYEKIYICLGNSQTTGLNIVWSYPVKILHIH